MLPRRSLAAVLWASASRLFLRHIGVFCSLCVVTAGAETLSAEQGSRRVVVLGSHKNPAIIENLRAELAMQGLTLLDQTTSERPTWPRRS